jgi:hypothetical protein
MAVTPTNSSSTTGQEGRGRGLRPVLAEPDSQGRSCGLIEMMQNRPALDKKSPATQELPRLQPILDTNIAGVLG